MWDGEKLPAIHEGREGLPARQEKRAARITRAALACAPFDGPAIAQQHAARSREAQPGGRGFAVRPLLPPVDPDDEPPDELPDGELDPPEELPPDAEEPVPPEEGRT